MKMEINIKKIGITQGTVGYLANGLESGEITIKEGKLKTLGNHGLWLHIQKDGGKQESHFLAAFNQYNLSPGEYETACTYETANSYEDRDPLWTDAAWRSLMTIAQDWCDTLNEQIDEEPELKIEIKRIETIS